MDDRKSSIFDPHFLNAAFRDEITSSANFSGSAWIDSSLVRFVPARKARARKGFKEWSVGSGIRALAALRVDYLVSITCHFFLKDRI